MEATNSPDLIHERRWIILGIMSLSLVIVMLNNVKLNVALPELSKDLQADNTDLQWIVDSYALIFGGTLLVMGALGDRFGRKKALQLGLILLGLASSAAADQRSNWPSQCLQSIGTTTLSIQAASSQPLPAH